MNQTGDEGSRASGLARHARFHQGTKADAADWESTGQEPTEVAHLKPLNVETVVRRIPTTVPVKKGGAVKAPAMPPSKLACMKSIRAPTSTIVPSRTATASLPMSALPG